MLQKRSSASAVALSHKERAMSNLRERILSVLAAASALGVKRYFLAFLAASPASSAFAGDLEPIFNEVVVRDFPQAIYDKIRSKIVHQTTFVQVSPAGLVRFSARTIKLVDFVKALSP